MTREVPLSRGLVALVDDEDFDLISRYLPWHACPSGGHTWYARHSITGQKKVAMHVLLTGWERVDHIDLNGLNNQRRNLRRASRSENLANQSPIRANNTTGFKGVSRLPSGNYQGRIGVRNKHYSLGSYPTPEEAARAYDAAAIRHFGEFARLNFPPGAAA